MQRAYLASTQVLSGLLLLVGLAMVVSTRHSRARRRARAGRGARRDARADRHTGRLWLALRWLAASDSSGGRRALVAGRARERMRRGSERVGGRIVRGLGEPALFAVTFERGGVDDLLRARRRVRRGARAAPCYFLVAGLFLMVTMTPTYVEGSSLHIERGGASTFARYAIDELELHRRLGDPARLRDRDGRRRGRHHGLPGGVWDGLDDGGLEIAAGPALLFVAVSNVRGLSADRLE